MSNKGWTAIYHWIWPITPAFTEVLQEGRSLLSILCVTAEAPRLTGPSLPLAGQAWHGLGPVERLCKRAALAPCAGHLCYKRPPSLWSGTRLSKPGLAKLLWVALLLPCVPCGSKNCLPISSPYQRPIICSIVFWGWTFVSLFCYFNDTSALIAASQSSVRLSPVALRDKMIALESVIRLICYLWINWFPH